MRHRIAAAVSFALLSGPALAAGVSVPMDEVRTVSFSKPVATVFIGNSVVADVNMIDAHHAFIVGKAFGTTNLIALDSNGREISNTYVSVSENRGATVTLLKGSAQLTMSCGGPRCEVSPIPGDNKFKEDYGDVSAHHEFRTRTAQQGQ